MKKILLTWWTWYIGSHTAIEFIEKWFEVVIVDNLFNSDISVLENIKKITWVLPKFYKLDLKDKNSLKKIFEENNFSVVVHFAWLKAVWESCENPFLYYENNIIWSLNLFEMMEKFWVKKIIFSSSATVYDSEKQKAPFSEKDFTWNTKNPYWTTKFILENILKDLFFHKNFSVVNLRYFNPIWAHNSWFIWENPNWVPNNLVPYIMKVIFWEIENLQIFWWDYKTKDGTWERDYIHIMDLAFAHFKAFLYLEKNENIYEEINIWTWKATSVLDLVKISEKICLKKIPFKITKRRSWDIDRLFCKPEKAKNILWWEAKYSIEEAILSQYNFMKNKKTNS